MRLRALLRRASHGLCALLLLATLLQAAPARADDPWSTEFWPELNAYVGLDERSRLLFTAAATRAMEGQRAPGKAISQDAQFTLNFDYAGADPAPRRAQGGMVEEPPAVIADRLRIRHVRQLGCGCVPLLHRHPGAELALSDAQQAVDHRPTARGPARGQRRFVTTLPRAPGQRMGHGRLRASGRALRQHRAALRHTLRQVEPTNAEDRAGDTDRRRLARRALSGAAVRQARR